MFALLGIAAHLSIQIHAQQRAEQMIQQWGEKAGVSIGDVRYHLLRNGLILQNIHIQRGDDSINIEHLLVRADPGLLTSNKPRIGKVALSGLQADIHAPGKTFNWQQDQHLKRIWQATTALTIRDGNMKLHLADSNAPPLELTSIFMRQRLRSSIRHLSGNGLMHGGTVNWQWQISAQHSVPGQGAVNWQHVEAATFTKSLGLKQTTGHFSGQFDWQSSPSDSNIQTINAMQAEMHLDTASNTETADMHHLQWTATKHSEQWKVDVQARAWPLDPWSEELPSIGGRNLISAQLDGSSHWSGHPGDWTITSDKGQLNGVTFAAADHTAAAWRWARMQYTDARMNMGKKRLQLATLNMTDARLALKPDVETHETALDSASANEQKVWGISADRIAVDGLTLTLAMPQGNISLTELNGTGQWPRWGPLSFKLRTIRPSTSEQDMQQNRAQWSLRGTAKRGKTSQLVSANMRLRGSHIPASQLRPLLPLQDDTNRPVKLAGDINLKTEITVERGVWQMQGKASALELNLSRGGENWLIKELSSRFGPVGMGLASQRISKLDIEGWHYIAALHPLPPLVTNPTDTQQHLQANPPVWWASSLRNQHVEIDHINLSDGTVSVGNAQAVWAKQLNIQLDSIKVGQWTNISLKGEASGGSLNMRGKWDILSDTQRFYGTAELAQATPFFLHHWMHASGLPRPIRGRLSAYLNVSEAKEADSYQSSLKIKLVHGLLENRTSVADPMLARTGYNTPVLLQRLDDGTGHISVQSANAGNWSSEPLTLETLGISLQSAMHKKALEWKADEKKQALAEPAFETQIRLHGRKLLSQNERSRIFKIVKKLRRQPKLIVELKPQWMGDDLSLDTLRRIQRTQQLIENYMTHRNIDPSRILPVWPTEADQTKDVGFIQIVTRISG